MKTISATRINQSICCLRFRKDVSKLKIKFIVKQINRPEMLNKDNSFRSLRSFFCDFIIPSIILIWRICRLAISNRGANSQLNLLIEFICMRKTWRGWGVACGADESNKLSPWKKTCRLTVLGKIYHCAARSVEFTMEMEAIFFSNASRQASKGNM